MHKLPAYIGVTHPSHGGGAQGVQREYSNHMGSHIQVTGAMLAGKRDNDSDDKRKDITTSGGTRIESRAGCANTCRRMPNTWAAVVCVGVPSEDAPLDDR